MRQYAIRNIPSTLDRALREWARQRNISLNQAIIDAIKIGIGLDEVQEHNDLDDLIGTWQQDEEFDQALSEQDTIEHDL